MLVTRRRRIVEEEVTQVITNTNSDDNWKKCNGSMRRTAWTVLNCGIQPNLTWMWISFNVSRELDFTAHMAFTLSAFSCGLRKDVAFWLGGIRTLEKVHSELRPNCDFVKQLGKLRDQMKYELNRLYSFSSWWLKDYQLDASVTARLARAGFFYSRKRYRVFLLSYVETPVFLAERTRPYDGSS